MKLGAEPKKIAIFVALIIVAGIVYWINSPDAPSPAAARPSPDAASATVAPVSVPDEVSKSSKKRVVNGHGGLTDWNPRPPDAVDPGKIDPTLRLDLLAKVQAVGVEGGTRDLFQFCADCAAREKAAEEAKLGPVPTVPNRLEWAHSKPKEVVAPTPAPPQPAGPPPVPAINLKYYGYSTKYSDGEKRPSSSTGKTSSWQPKER